MNNRTLTIVFLVLLAIYGLNQLFSGRQESTFRTELVQLDTALVDRIELFPKAGEGSTVTLEREDNQWTVSNGSLTAPAVTNAVSSVLGQLQLMRAKRVVAKQEEKWKDYEVDESTGARVKAYGNDQVLADFVVGRFSFNQQTRQALSYVRLSDEAEVYAVDGFLSMTFGQDMNAFRNKQILKLDAGEEVSGLQLQAGPFTADFQRVNGNWMLNNEAVLDSTAMAGYLNGLRYVNGNAFADDFRPGGNPEKQLQIVLPTRSITIAAYRDEGGERDFAVQSSQFPDAFFASDSSGIYNRLFGELEALAGR